MENLSPDQITSLGEFLRVVLNYGGFGILALFFLWDKRETQKRYMSLQRQNSELVKIQTEILSGIRAALSELSSNMKYNLFCPILKSDKKPSVRKKKSGNTDTQRVREEGA